MNFKIHSPYKPTGDQPQAIEELSQAIGNGTKAVTLLGVTGSGKTFTMANVIERLNRPALILSHNKTLAAQLYGEFKSFFPENAVEYFVSYYDYYQPEAYMPVTDTYIEKDLSINEEIEKLRLSCTSQLLSGRRDIIVVSSVSCLYGIGNPEDFHENTVTVKAGQRLGKTKFLYSLVEGMYNRNDTDFKRGTFRVRGDSVDIFLAYGDMGCRIFFFGDQVEEIELFDPLSGVATETLEEISIYPANIFVTTKERTKKAIFDIQDDLRIQCEYLDKAGKHLEAKRLKQRTEYDIEMIKELGYCPGIENYSRYFDGRPPGTRPFCLLDYFPDDYVTFIDESHVTVPQIRAMYGGDRSRKLTLIEYGFRLPAAADNRPLKFDEFEQLTRQCVYVSATPADYELEKSEGLIVEQVVRPTGLLEPPIEIRPTENQIDDLMEEIELRVERDERVLVTTLTKRMAEELDKYMQKAGVRCRYIHSDVDTLERVEIIEDFQAGRFDVLIGVNLLREGLDMPQVSLVAILDADKEGFLRSETALTQIAGRAARNIHGMVIMYADTITGSMRRTMDETERRRKKQQEYNRQHGITPKQIEKQERNILGKGGGSYTEEFLSDTGDAILADPVLEKMDKAQLLKAIDYAKREMERSAKELDFVNAAKHRDQMNCLKRILEKRESEHN
ncbi:MAG: excinuclease ABC subunit UvrB [Bacteroidetes bacterium]|uniref:UvrABC system protein B n=1 Tax=Candidatus Egerieousia excrementavium TaxID=2840778 RepID=A0A9D9DIJ9_9BACT|nr:excinuclease ABC subunit UvrB [Candidatus Egerieousia excrementavium]